MKTREDAAKEVEEERREYSRKERSLQLRVVDWKRKGSEIGYRLMITVEMQKIVRVRERIERTKRKVEAFSPSD